MFAVAMSLVLVISTALLLYQFWTGALAERETSDASAATLHALPEERATLSRPVDSAA
jgi:hypothetical protein